MSHVLQQEHHLIGDIYDAALQPTLWASVVRKLTELAQAEKGNILAYDRLNPEYFLFHSHGVTPEQMQQYHDGGFAALDQEFCFQWMGQPGNVLTNHASFASMAECQQRAGRLYSDFFSKVGVHYQVGGMLERSDFRWSVLGLHRSEAGQPFADEIVDSLRRLAPHLQRSLQIHRQITHLNQQSTRLYRMLDMFSTGVLLLGHDGRVRYANQRTESLLQSTNAIQVDAYHRISARHHATNLKMQQAILDAASTSRRENSSGAFGGVIAVPQQAGRSPLMLTITPLSEFAGYEELGQDGIAAALFLTDPSSKHQVSRKILTQAYALSSRECDICEAFLNQSSLEKTAAACGLSLATVRTYIKEIYEKTGQHTQAELMRLLMGLTLDFEHIPDVRSRSSMDPLNNP